MDLIELSIPIIVSIILGVLLREPLCRYWKINRRIELMEEQNKLLKIIAGIKTDELIVQDEINKQESKKMVQYHTDKGVIEIAPCISYVGENVFMNGEAAPDGKYKLGFMNYINVKNGVVIK